MDLFEPCSWIKRGFIYKPSRESSWWQSHAMAPAALCRNDGIRIFLGCWDDAGISRIGYLDVDKGNPAKVLNISRQPVLDIGAPGCFDDNGVFPGHIMELDGKIFLYYTGFQLLKSIPFTNFSGIAISEDNGNTFKRLSRTPVLDRAEEGLHSRAGASFVFHEGRFRACYSAGSEWKFVAGKNRPVYNVYYQELENCTQFNPAGQIIVRCGPNEHGLGRPQIISLFRKYFVFYTRRLLDFKYHMGVAYSENFQTWTRIDEWLSIPHGESSSFDSDMVYFPCVVNTGEKIFLFYSGNSFGREGLGYAELVKDRDAVFIPPTTGG